jgi:hypothetical protein
LIPCTREDGVQVGELPDEERVLVLEIRNFGHGLGFLDLFIAAEAIGLGASGYLLKTSPSGELFTAIEQALAGKTYITPLLTKGAPP